MKNYLLLFVALVLHTGSVFSQTALLREPLSPSPLLVSEPFKRYAPNTLNLSLGETLDHVFDSITALSPIKGFNAALLLPDGSVWKRAKGLSAQLPVAKPLTTDHLMGMGSISKSFVAATLLLLYDDGLLGLDDSIGQYVGPYPNVPGSVTIRQLLSHRSGLNDYLNENPATTNAWFANLDSIWSADTILTHYVLAPNFPADSSWSYSNTNYLIAGRILESITGQPWYLTVRQRLLDPLGLTHTFAFPWETPGAQPFSHVWADIDGNGTVEDIQGFGLPTEGLFSIAGSAGCLITTPEDLTRFSERLYGGHVLKAATLAEMETDYIQGSSGSLYGLGASSFPFPQAIENWGHNGDLIYKAFALYFPSEKMALAVQQNDDRSYNPADPTPVLDLYLVYLALLDAYLEYAASTPTHEPIAASDRVLAVPNPVGQSFRMQFSSDARPEFPLLCTLTDVNGRTVASQIIENDKAEIETGQLPSGVYGLRAAGFSGKILKY